LLHNDGRPGRDDTGSNDSSAAHCSSVRSNRRVTARVSTRSPVVFWFFLVDEPTTGDLTYLSRRHALHRQLQPDLPEQTSIQALEHIGALKTVAATAGALVAEVRAALPAESPP
jgi:hypothetical protein